MANLIENRYHKKKNYQEYAREQLIYYSCTIPELKAFYKENNLAYNNKWLKEQAVDDAIQQFGIDYLIDKFHIGVIAQVYIFRFGITHQDVKRLAKFGVLHICSYYNTSAYGTTLTVPLYDLMQYVNMTDEQIQQLLKDYPKGKRKGAK